MKYYGVDFHAGLTGNVIFWEASAIDQSFYQNQFNFGGLCFGSVDQPSIDNSDSNTKREIEYPGAVYQDQQELVFKDSAYEGLTPDSHQSLNSSLAVRHVPSVGESSGIVKRFLPGNLFCPQVDNEVTSSQNGTDCSCYDDNEANEPFDTLTRRAMDNDTTSIPLHMLSSESSLKTCPNIKVPIPTYQKTPIVAYYDLANPTGLDPTYSSYTPTIPINLGTNGQGRPFMALGGVPVYAREHPYEVSMGKVFFS